MYNFWALASFEYKKLLRRKILWITLALMMALCVFSGLSALAGNEYVNGQIYESHAEALQKSMAYERALSGRKLDGSLLSEMQEAFARVPDVELARVTEEYQTYARPYEAVWSIAFVLAGRNGWETVTEEELYQARRDSLEEDWIDAGLSEREKEFLRNVDSHVEIPLTFQYTGGCGVMIQFFYTLGVMQALLIAICVPFLFAEEHSRKTDQLIQCGSLGKKPLFLAKLLTGFTFSLAATLLLCLSAAVPVFAVYGIEGGGAALQLLNPGYPWPLTLGEAGAILLGISLICALLHASAAMLLSEYFRSSMATLAVMVGFLMASLLFNVPEEYRILAQIWNCIPANSTSVWGAFGSYLFPFFGTFLTAWQAVPVIYLLLCLLASVLCFRVYRGFQAGGR